MTSDIPIQPGWFETICNCTTVEPFSLLSGPPTTDRPLACKLYFRAASSVLENQGHVSLVCTLQSPPAPDQYEE